VRAGAIQLTIFGPAGGFAGNARTHTPVALVGLYCIHLALRNSTAECDPAQVMGPLEPGWLTDV
jgi:hypothetical protein